MHKLVVIKFYCFFLYSPELTYLIIPIFQVLLAMQRKELPGNLHFSSPNPEIPALLDGRIKVLTHLIFKEFYILIFRVNVTSKRLLVVVMVVW